MPMTDTTARLRELAARALEDESVLDELAFQLQLAGHLTPGPAGGTDDDAERHRSELERFRSLLELRRALRKDAGTLTREGLLARAARLFERHPTLQSFGWRQSTPTMLYDDGPGLMVAYTREPFLDGEQHGSAPDDETLAAAWSDVCALLGSYESRELAAAFGDGYHLTVSREGELAKEHWWPDDDY